ncbi:MAG: CoA transferase [Actinobacteria bacterium]|nr:CoA transferase [Actinomycetota bacterium]
MPMPLEGMRVLDLTRLLPGPFCTLLLADMGADVIKVEDTDAGDYLRFMPPLSSSGMSIHFHTLNRNKRSIAIDLKRKEGRELLLELATWADVLVEQFRPGVMKRLELGYETIKEVNPSIIYCSITGYGQDGPYRDTAGHDINYLGYAGVLDSTGSADGPPVMCGVQIADLGGGGMFGAFSILTAYIYMMRTGEGQHVDVSMTDGSASWLTVNTGELFMTGEGPARGTQVLQGAFPCYNVYEAGDGYMAVGALENKFWQRLCEILGRPEYGPEQFNPRKTDEMFAWLRDKFKEKTRAGWMEVFAGEDACVSPVLSISEMASDPQVLHREMVVEVEDEKLGRTKTLGIPVKFGATPGEIRRSAPGLGEHTAEVLEMLGCSVGEIEQLKADGVIC